MAPLIYVMGPSGAGKDSVMGYARSALRAGERIAFAHRYVTRPPDPRRENYVTLTNVEFDTRCAAGLFAFHWQAHGFRYAIGIEVESWRRAGFVVVVNGSRGHFKSLAPRPEGIVPVLVAAPPDVIAARLAARGREDQAARAARLERNAALTVEDASITTIDNSGALERAGALLLALLRRVASGS